MEQLADPAPNCLLNQLVAIMVAFISACEEHRLVNAKVTVIIDLFNDREFQLEIAVTLAHFSTE